MSAVYILGGAQTDFARNWHREGLRIDDVMAEAVQGAITQTGIDPADIAVGHVGNFVGELFSGQGVLGSVLAEVIPELNGIPTSRHEAACASGSMAAFAAMADIESGRYPLACVVGVEFMRNVPGKTAAEYLGTAAWAGKEGLNAKYLWPAMFSDIAEAYDQRWGLDHQHLFAIADINYANGKRNPAAQTRGWEFANGFGPDDDSNPIIEGRLRRSDCAQVTDGAACVFLASEDYAQQYAQQRGLQLTDLPRIKGWGHTSSRIDFQAKLHASAAKDGQHGLMFPHVATAINDTFQRAELSIEQIDAIETHDCFTISEYMAIDHFGITQPGQAWKAVESGKIAFDGDLPINPSGGLIGLGHPVGATGVRMLLDGYKQTTNQAGDYQVAAARNVALLNIGGTTSSVASFVVGTS